MHLAGGETASGQGRSHYSGEDVEKVARGGEASTPASQGWRVYVAPVSSSEGLGAKGGLGPSTRKQPSFLQWFPGFCRSE